MDEKLRMRRSSQVNFLADGSGDRDFEVLESTRCHPSLHSKVLISSSYLSRETARAIGHACRHSRAHHQVNLFAEEALSLG